MNKKPHLPSVPLDEQKLTVTSIESVQVLEFFPDLLWVRVHTDQGIVGHGEIIVLKLSNPYYMTRWLVDYWDRTA